MPVAREVQNAEKKAWYLNAVPRQRIRRPIRSPGVMVQKNRLGAPDVSGRQAPRGESGADYVERPDPGDHGLALEPEDLPKLWYTPDAAR